MRRSRKFCQTRGSNFDNVFFTIFFYLVDTTISGRADDGPTLNAGLVAL